MYTIECYLERIGDWIPYAEAKTEQEARQKAANAFIKTRHICVRIMKEASQ